MSVGSIFCGSVRCVLCVGSVGRVLVSGIVCARAAHLDGDVGRISVSHAAFSVRSQSFHFLLFLFSLLYCCLLCVSGCGARPFFQYACADGLLLLVFDAVGAVTVCSGA